MSIRELNKYQTALSEELKESLHHEIWEELMDCIENIQFITNVTALEETRGYVKDRPKDSKGRVIVDLTNPHILEDMDYFRERAIFYEKNKCYTHLRPNPNPKSEYALFWKEEVRKWKDGLTRPDGEWISGYYYFYLNYCPIWLNIISEDNSTKKKADRVRSFPRVWLGDYLFFHYLEQAISTGSHFKMLKTRGIGASFKFSGITPCNMYTKTGLPNFHLASDKTFLEGDKGVFGKIVDNLDWISNETPLPRMRLINRLSDMEIQLGYQDEYGRRRGLKSSVFGISLKDNPQKARGVRGPLIHYEEDGLFKNLETAWNVNRKAVEDGDNVFGILAAAGTGGVSGADFEGSEKLFRNPQAYNIYGIPNVFDKNIKGTSLCGFFWGAYLNRANCYDSVNGEPDIVKALIEILKDRFLVKYSSADPSAITQKKAEECITPAEAVMQTSGTIFPVSDLKDYLDSIKAQGNGYFNSHYVGELITNSNNEIKWSPSDAFPLRQYRLHASDDKMGAVEIFEMPKKDSSGIISNRYIVSCDPYDDDTGTSLGSIFVFDTFNQCIVAEYTGRPKFADDLYEICRRLTIFYNAKCGYESNKKGLFTYFSQRNCLYLLAENPSILVDKELMKGNQIGNKAYGVHATAEINAWARRLIRDWLLKPAAGAFQEYDDEGNQLTQKLNMHTVRSIPLLEELIAWNGDINTDRVSSYGICMIINEEYKKFNQVFTNKEQTKDFADNDYFTQYNKYSFSYGRTP